MAGGHHPQDEHLRPSGNWHCEDRADDTEHSELHDDAADCVR
jgi:hypothetical protein